MVKIIELDYNTLDKELRNIKIEEEMPEARATSLLCSKYDFSVVKEDKNSYCKAKYECMYKSEDTDRCMNLKKRYMGD